MTQLQALEGVSTDFFRLLRQPVPRPRILAPEIGNAVVGANSDSFDTTEAVWSFLRRFSRAPD